MPSSGSVEARRPAAISYESCVALLLMVAVVAPLVVVPGVFFPYVVPRNILFRVAVELGAAIRILQVILGGKRFDFRREYVLLALIGFLTAITVSSLFSPARAHSFFGDFERMGGVWAWLHLAGFFLLLRTIGEKQFTWILHIALAGGMGASLHAIVSFSDTGSRTIVGNSGLLAGYLLVGLPIASYLAAISRKHRWLYALAAAVELWALLVTQNRSSVLGLVVGGAVASFLSGLAVERRRTRRILLSLAVGFIATGVALAAVLKTTGNSVLATRVPGAVRRIAETDFAGGDAMRAFQWEAAIAGFRERPMFGFGPENHHLVWSANFDPRSEQIGGDVFDRAHNQYLEFLATTGIVGTVMFLAVWGAIGYSLYRAFSAGRLTVGGLAVLAGANAAYAAYLVFWFVDINAAILWMLLSALIAARSNPLPVLRETGRRLSRPLALVGSLVTGSALVFILHRHAYVPIRASIALATLDSYSGDGEVPTAAVETIADSRAHQTSHFAPVLSRFVQISTGDATLATTPTKARVEQLDRGFQAAISAFDAELGRDPLNDRLHTAAAQLLIEAATFYDSAAYLERAIRLLERAVELNPRRTRQRRVLAEALVDYSVPRERSGN